MKTQIEGFGLKDVMRNTSLAGWVLLARPVIYFLFSRRRDLDSYAAVDFSALVFILYSVVAFVVGWRVIARSQSQFGKTILEKSPIYIFLLYSGLGLLSMAWSVNFSLTGFRAFECISMTLLIVAVIQELFETGSPKFVILWSLLYCTWNVIWAIVRVSQWTIDISLLLESAQMMSTCFFFMALYFMPRKWYNYLTMIMSIFSMSTVSYIGMAVGAISSFWGKGRIKLIAVAGAFVLLVMIVAFGPKKLLKDTIFFDKKDVSIEETSGRDKLMEATIECVSENPFGLGFFAAEPYVLYSKGLHAIGAHNSLFSAGMGMGVPGIILMALFLIAIGRATFSRYIPKSYKTILIGCFCVALMHCMGNPSVGTRVFGAWIPCMYIFVLISSMYVYGKYFEIEGDETEEGEEEIE